MKFAVVIALAYTSAALRGEKVKCLGQQKYVNRLKKLQRLKQCPSNFWVGLYGHPHVLPISPVLFG